MSGLSRTPGKRVWVNSPPRVRIPPSPPIANKNAPHGAFFFTARHRERSAAISHLKGVAAAPFRGLAMTVGLADDGDLVALAFLEGEQGQGAVFHVALFVKADGSSHALVTAGFGEGWQVLGRI